MTRERVLAWDGCVNVRDLGGLPLARGGETQFGVVVRADSVTRLTERGWLALRDYGVRVAVDLREDDELVDDPPGAIAISVVRVPLLPWDRAHPTDERPSLRDGYLALLSARRPEFARAVTALAIADGPAVVYCQGGRDRTGLVAALVLALADVEPEAIAADHRLSEQSWEPFHEAWFAEAESDEELDRRRHLVAPAGCAMLEVLDEVDATCGGARDYLLAGGASPADLDSLVLRLRP